MQYPLISEYIDAISMAEDNLDELSNLAPVLDKRGKPVMSGGNFAAVFKMQDRTTGKYYALKCFTREQDTRQEDYIKIAKELSYVSSPYIVGVRYLPKELFVDTTQSDEEEFPVLLMDWVEGQTLDNYLRSNINNSAAIRELSSAFNRMAIWLLTQPFAHGDLKPDNIIVNASGELVLVDYDGMYVPSMKGKKSKETGSPNFRHPQRFDEWFDETIDDFSLSLMATALYALTLQPDLLQQYEAKDAILFTEKDLLNLPQSKLYSSLSALLYDKTFAKLFSLLQLSFARVAIRGQYATMFAQDEAKQEAYKSLYDKAMKLYQTSDDKTEAYRLLFQAADMDFVSNHIQVCFKTDEDIKREKARIESYTSLATNNDATAQLIIGECYYFGWGVEQDYGKAVEWYKKSAEQGNAVAQCNLVYCYHKGQGVEQDYGRAVEWLNKSAEQGNAVAQCILGICYEYGQGVEQDYKKAVEWYKKSAEQGNAVAQKNLGVCYYKGQGVDQDYKQAVEWYKKSAEQGYAAAQCNLGYCYHKGQGVEQDYKKAVEWYKKSAEQGYAAAQFDLGYCYQYGQGVDKDYRKAVENYEFAAKNSSVKAQKRLAEIYKKGILGVSKNQKESFKWYLIAAKGGNYDAAFYVALSYANGNGIDKDYVEAVRWYKIAAEHGSSSAMNNLAVCYENGHGVEKDEEKAFSLYLKAAEAGGLIAANNVSVCYQKGTGTEVNPQQALFWKEKAAQGGNSKAQGVLAEWYFKGYGTERNYEKALYYFIKSKLDKEENIIDIENLFDFIIHKASDGIALFQYLLAKCYAYGVFVPKDWSSSMMWYEKSAANGFIESLIKLRRIDSISTEATKEEKAAGVKDEHGVLYSQDWKKVLSCSFVHCKSYNIRKGTRVICNGAFDNQCIERLIIPSSVVAIGENPFASDSYYHGTKIAIENQSPNYIVNEDALYTKDGRTIVSYWGKQTQFAVPEQVRYIAHGCFSNARNLETIFIPQGVESIGRKAFECCYSLKSLDLPKSVKFIGESAFWGCEALEEIWSLGSIRIIEPNTFEGCNLKYVHFPSCLVSIMDDAFNSNRKLRNIDLPDTLETIGNHAFAYCSNLERINLGDSVKFIGDFCFYGCAINEVRLPSSLTNLGTRPFDNVGNIITKRDSLYKAEGGMLINTKTKNLECIFGDSPFVTLKDIKSISPLAFYESKVVEVVLSNDVILLPEYTFYNSQDLINIKLSDRLESIGTGSFYGCEKLCGISIPKSVQEVNSGAFCRCVSLEMIELKGLATNVSESIIEYIDYEHFPSAYHSHRIKGSITRDIGDWNYEPNAESVKCITIVVPKSTKNKYTFKPVYHLELDEREMDRRFKIIENDENC